MSVKNLIFAAAGQVTGGEYQISRSLRFNSADSAYLERTPASAGNRRTWTWSGWVKRSGLGTEGYIFSGAGAATGTTVIRFETNNTINFYTFDNVYTARINTSQVFRDVSSWYHIVAVFNTNSATTTLTGSATDRLRLYINGVQVSAFSDTVVPTIDYEGFINSNVPQTFNARYNGSYVDINGNFYLTEIHFIDGQALDETDFGEINATTGVWSPIEYTGSYGTNGFYLNFSDNSTIDALGTDFSGNGNTWDDNGFFVTAGAGNDSLVDTPTQFGTDTGAGGEVRGNYATLNAVSISTGFPYVSISNGNLGVAGTSAVNDGVVPATVSAKTGKYYWEYTSAAYSAGGYSRIGIMPIEGVFGGGANGYLGGFANSCGYDPTGTLVKTGGNTTSWGATWGATDVIGVALDCDNGAVYFSKNGVFQNSGVPTSGASKTGAAITWTGGTIDMYPICDMYQTTSSGDMNFGQRPFDYTAPSGFKALVTTNLPEPTVVQGDEYFNTVLYTGNTPSTNAITGVGFAPDWVWVKSRTAAEPSNLVDRVRGDNLRLKSSTTDAESAATFALNSDGFTVGANSESNTGSMVAWNWKANGAGVSNTDGTIASTVSVSTTSGFSIVRWDGNGAGVAATIGHGLGAVPKMIINKGLDFASAWSVYHASAGNTVRLTLNTTDAVDANAGWWNNTTPTSTVFTVGSIINQPTPFDYVAYCFAEVEGFSKFGSYTGNGSADGPFVYTGFRPAWVMIKGSGQVSNWQMLDTARDPFNAAQNFLRANSSNAEASLYPVDINSNGFKIRTTDSDYNTNAQNYIFMAFAESPFKFALGR